MFSDRGRIAAATAFAVLSLVAFWTVALWTPAHANPATVDYKCKPALSGGGALSVDFNSGGKSVIAQFPDGKSVRMPGRTKRFYMYFAGENTKLWGINQKTVTLAIMGQPTRKCVATSL